MARRLFLYKNEGTAVISGTGTVVMLPEVSEGYSASFQVLLEKAAEALRVGESGVALFALNGSPIRQRQLWEIPGENADLIVVPNTEDCHQRSLSTAAPPMLSGYAVLSWIKGHHGELQHLTVEEIAYSMGLPPAVAPHCEGHESGSEAAVCQGVFPLLRLKSSPGFHVRYNEVASWKERVRKNLPRKLAEGLKRIQTFEHSLGVVEECRTTFLHLQKTMTADKRTAIRKANLLKYVMERGLNPYGYVLHFAIHSRRDPKLLSWVVPNLGATRNPDIVWKLDFEEPYAVDVDVREILLELRWVDEPQIRAQAAVAVFDDENLHLNDVWTELSAGQGIQLLEFSSQKQGFLVTLGKLPKFARALVFVVTGLSKATSLSMRLAQMQLSGTQTLCTYDCDLDKPPNSVFEQVNQSRVVCSLFRRDDESHWTLKPLDCNCPGESVVEARLSLQYCGAMSQMRLSEAKLCSEAEVAELSKLAALAKQVSQLDVSPDSLLNAPSDVGNQFARVQQNVLGIMLLLQRCKNDAAGALMEFRGAVIHANEAHEDEEDNEYELSKTRRLTSSEVSDLNDRLCAHRIITVWTNALQSTDRRCRPMVRLKLPPAKAVKSRSATDAFLSFLSQCTELLELPTPGRVLFTTSGKRIKASELMQYAGNEVVISCGEPFAGSEHSRIVESPANRSQTPKRGTRFRISGVSDWLQHHKIDDLGLRVEHLLLIVRPPQPVIVHGTGRRACSRTSFCYGRYWDMVFDAKPDHVTHVVVADVDNFVEDCEQVLSLGVDPIIDRLMCLESSWELMKAFHALYRGEVEQIRASSQKRRLQRLLDSCVRDMHNPCRDKNLIRRCIGDSRRFRDPARCVDLDRGEVYHIDPELGGVVLNLRWQGTSNLMVASYGDEGIVVVDGVTATQPRSVSGNMVLTMEGVGTQVSGPASPTRATVQFLLQKTPAKIKSQTVAVGCRLLDPKISMELRDVAGRLLCSHDLQLIGPNTGNTVIVGKMTHLVRSFQFRPLGVRTTVKTHQDPGLLLISDRRLTEVGLDPSEEEQGIPVIPADFQDSIEEVVRAAQEVQSIGVEPTTLCQVILSPEFVHYQSVLMDAQRDITAFRVEADSSSPEEAVSARLGFRLFPPNASDTDDVASDSAFRLRQEAVSNRGAEAQPELVGQKLGNRPVAQRTHPRLKHDNSTAQVATRRKPRKVATVQACAPDESLSMSHWHVRQFEKGDE